MTQTRCAQLNSHPVFSRVTLQQRFAALEQARYEVKWQTDDCLQRLSKAVTHPLVSELSQHHWQLAEAYREILKQQPSADDDVTKLYAAGRVIIHLSWVLIAYHLIQEDPPTKLWPNLLKAYDSGTQGNRLQDSLQDHAFIAHCHCNLIDCLKQAILTDLLKHADLTPVEWWMVWSCLPNWWCFLRIHNKIKAQDSLFLQLHGQQGPIAKSSMPEVYDLRGWVGIRCTALVAHLEYIIENKANAKKHHKTMLGCSSYYLTDSLLARLLSCVQSATRLSDKRVVNTLSGFNDKL